MSTDPEADPEADPAADPAPAPAPRWAFAALLALVAGVAVHLVIVVFLEPYAFDAWNLAADTKDQPFSFGNWVGYAHDQYMGGNPRLGQVLAYLVYKVPWTAGVLTPVAWLAFAGGIVALGLGRLPSPRVRRDLALCAFVLGAMWFALPFPGTIVFTRAYAANYLYSAAAQIWFLYLVRRYDAAWAVAPRAWHLVGAGILALVAGACNEHTGPMLAIVTAGVIVHLWRRRGEKRALLFVALAGVVAGYAYLFFAPGHDVHYDGLAGEASLAQRTLSRGIGYNAYILRELLVAAAPVLTATLLVLLTARGDRDLARARRGVLVALGAGVVIALTLFASPKLGPRFFFLPLALMLAAFVGLADAARPGRKATLLLVGIGVFASGYVAYASISLYARLHHSSDTRLSELRAARAGEAVVVTPWEIVDMHWLFWGDDFKDPRKRRLVQEYLRTGPIEWFGPSRAAPLGVTGIGFSVELEPPGADPAAFEPASWEVDLPLLARQLDFVVRGARARAEGLTAAAIRVRVPARPEGLPELPIVVARWTPAGAEVYPVGVAFASTSGTSRLAAVPPALASAQWFVWPIGLPARAATSTGSEVRFAMAPGRTHWLLACVTERCFVTAVVR
jgi:hypothetical protein